MSVKRAGVKAMESILFVINTSVRNAYRSIIPVEQFRDPVLTLEQLSKEFELMRFYAYMLENRIIGVAALRINKRKIGIVRWVHVLPEHRRLGVGMSLMKHIEGEAKKDETEEASGRLRLGKSILGEKLLRQTGLQEIKNHHFAVG